MIEPKEISTALTDNDCIAVLENIKSRARFYDEVYPYDKDYCSELAGLEAIAIDRAIKALRKEE